MKPILRWIRRFLLVCAISLLAWCGFVLIDARIFRKAEERQLSLPPSASAMLPVAATAGLIGRMEIPRLALSVIVMEGTTSKTLRRAAGHIAGTALPGQPGNVAISGHRDSFFRPLRNIEQNDAITFTRAQASTVIAFFPPELLNPTMSRCWIRATVRLLPWSPVTRFTLSAPRQEGS
jgi:sortase A